MFLDASVVVAIVGRERDHQEFQSRLTSASGPFYMSPLVRFEAMLGLSRRRRAAGPKSERRSAQALKDAGAAIDEFMREIAADEIPITAEIGAAAMAAAARYGKVAGHPAALNFGDCFAYACAKSLGVGLLYKGDDFAKTDLA